MVARSDRCKETQTFRPYGRQSSMAMRGDDDRGGGGNARTEPSSVLFSLGELMRLEEQRVTDEQRQADAARAAAERARREADERAAAEQLARLEAERARREAEERAAREEAARLEAMRAAAVERARIEAEERARMTAVAAVQEHEKSLVALREDASKKRLSRWLGGSIAAAVLLAAGSAGLYFGKIQPEAQARQRETAVALAEAKEELERTRRELEEREGAVARLQAERDAATDERKRAELAAQIVAEEKKIVAIRRGRGLPPPVPAAPRPSKNCGNPDDPLNDCL